LLQEFRHDRFILRQILCTGSINEPPFGARIANPRINKYFGERGKSSVVPGARRTCRIRPCMSERYLPWHRARSVVQHPRKLTPQRESLARITCRHDIAHPQVFQRIFQHGQLCVDGFMHPDDAVSTHDLCQAGRYTVRRSTRVTDEIPGLRHHDVRDQR